MKIKVYDKVKWHADNGIPKEIAIHYLDKLMKWLNNKGLLSEYGKEILKVGVDSDFSLTSTMLNEKGNKLLEEYYDLWLKTIDPFQDIDFSLLEFYLQHIK
jgi:hypothetical protein